MDRRPHFFSRPTFPLVTAGTSLLILLGVACGGKATSSSPAASVSPAQATTSPGSPVPTLTILSPRSGQRVSARICDGSRSHGGPPDAVRQEDTDVQARNESSAPGGCGG